MLFDGESDICCLSGKIKLQPINPPTDEVKNMYSGESATSKDFLKHIRGYNSRIAFTSLETKNVEIPGRGPPTFKISGRILTSLYWSQILNVLQKQKNLYQSIAMIKTILLFVSN